MKTYSEKELNRLLDPKARIVLLGSVLFSASKDFIKKIASKVKFVKDSDFGISNIMNSYISYDTKEELLNKKINDIEAKQEDISNAYYTVKDSLENFNNKSYYLKSLGDLYSRLERKRISYQESGLNKFSLPKLAFMQFKKNISSKTSKIVNTIHDKLDGFSTTVTVSNDKAVNNSVSDDYQMSYNPPADAGISVATSDKVNEKDDNEKIYKEIMSYFKQSLDARTKLDEYRLSYPDIYEKAISDLTTVNRSKTSFDNDFIEEVGTRKSSR